MVESLATRKALDGKRILAFLGFVMYASFVVAMPQPGADGLWKLHFADGTAVSAADCATNGATYSRMETADGVCHEWKAKEAVVRVSEQRIGLGKVAYVGRLTPQGKTAVEFDLPAALWFDGKTVNRFTMPQGTELGLGIAFNRKAFMPDPSRPILWRNGTAKGDPAKAWGGRLPVPCATNLLNFHAYRIGKGLLWIPPAVFRDKESRIRLGEFQSILERGRGRKRVATLLIPGARLHGACAADTKVTNWASRFASANLHGAEGVTISSVDDLFSALRGTDYRLILNVYGAQLPARDQREMDELVAAIGDFIRAGGEWVELSPFPFRSNIEPASDSFSYSIAYPSAFADFAHGDFTDGEWALYGVQPRGAHEPWKSPTIHRPAVLSCGADDTGAYFRHTWKTYAKPGETDDFPPVVVETGRGLQDACDDYVAENSLTRTFVEKVKDPAVRRKLVDATCIYLEPTAPLSWRRKALKLLPPPSIVHISRYAKHGYPDHYPLRRDFGTDDEFRAFLQEAKDCGHLFCPYTNPTWWNETSPTFAREGTACAAHDENGKPLREKWPEGKGVTTSPWHSTTRRCNRRILDLFTKEFPVDILFQDQVGARGHRLDFNAASPSPLAYCEGLLAAAEDDARIVPLATEQGWDQVANVEALCVNYSFAYLTAPGADVGILYKNRLRPDVWESEPVVLRMMHGKTLFMFHDLCKGCWTPRELAWILPHGFKLSWSFWKEYVEDCPQNLEWLEFLTRLQQAFTARVFVQPLVSYRHDRAVIADEGRDLMNPLDDGRLEVQWGDYTVAANLGPQPRLVGGEKLAPYGFSIRGPGLRAAVPAGACPFVETNGVRWTMSERMANVRYRIKSTGTDLPSTRESEKQTRKD